MLANQGVERESEILYSIYKWKSEKGGWLYIEDSQQDLYPMKANLYGI